MPLCLFAGVEAPGAEDVIVLGAAVSLTGKYSPHGTSTKNGYELAVRTINDKGGVRVRGKSYRLVVRYYDDQSNSARSTMLAERLIAQDRIEFLLGPYGPGPTRAMLPVVEKHSVPMVQAGSEERDLLAKGYRHVFAVVSSADQYLVSAVHLAAEQAEALGRLLEGLDAHVNLIPLNPTSAYDGHPTRPAAVKEFQATLARYGLPSTVRQRRGIDIAAGCGQLATKSQTG